MSDNNQLTTTTRKETYLSDNCETWEDLEIAYTKDPVLRQQLEKLLDKRRSNYRNTPEDHKQPEFPGFSPPLSDIAVKDELSLMDVAAFGLSTKPQFSSITHELKNGSMTITGSSDYGIATIYDYDIVLYMISHLVHEMNLVKKQVDKGITPKLPSRTFEPDIVSLLKFCRRPKGGKQYKWIEGALRRLKFTGIVSTFSDNDFRRSGALSYVNDFEVISRTKTGDIAHVKVDIPNWIYDGIVRPTPPTVLTMHSDYFLLREGVHRFLHRFARKTAGRTKSIYSVPELHKRSGSQRELKYFTRDLKKSIKALESSPLPDYDITFVCKGKGNNFVEFNYRGKLLDDKKIEQSSDFPKIKDETWELAKQAAPGYDVKDYLYSEWLSFWRTSGEKKLYNPDKAFISFCQKRYEKNPTP
jgi:plasmid replication initiation protein